MDENVDEMKFMSQNNQLIINLRKFKTRKIKNIITNLTTQLGILNICTSFEASLYIQAYMYKDTQKVSDK